MRRRLPVLLLLFGALLATACRQKPLAISYTWQAPRAAWEVTPPAARDDHSVTLTNHGPADVTLSRFARVDGPDFSSEAALLASVLPPDADPPTKTRALTALVHRSMFLGKRRRDLLPLYHDPVRALRLLGQGDAKPIARTLAMLLQAAGVEARMFNLDTHHATAVRWDDAWHLADPSFGIVFIDPQTGAIPSLRELALRPDLLRANLRAVPTPKLRRQIFELYEWYLGNEWESRLELVAGKAEPIPPWPLPVGAALTFDLASDGPGEGLWHWRMEPAQPPPGPAFLTLDNLTWFERGLDSNGSPHHGRVRLAVDLPHPVTRVALTAMLLSADSTGPDTSIYFIPPGQGAGSSARVHDGPLTPNGRFFVEKRFEAPLVGLVQIEIYIRSTQIQLAELELDLSFLHGPNAAPRTAGATTRILADARAANDALAELSVTHRWD